MMPLLHKLSGNSRKLATAGLAVSLVLGACASGSETSTTVAGQSTTSAEPGQTTTTTPATTTTFEERDVDVQLDWLPSNQNAGESVAIAKGFFAEEGLNVTLRPGGPETDPVQAMASGSVDLARLSSSPALMLAVSQGIPVQSFLVAVPEHPYAYFSLPDNPVTTPEDMVGKTIGISPFGGEVLLDAGLTANGLSRDDVNTVTVGFDLTPLVDGTVEVINGWTTDITGLKPLGGEYETLRLWDMGVHLYAVVYFSNTDTVADDPGLLERYTRALAKGWLYARDNPEEAIDILLETYPELNREDELAGLDAFLTAMFPESTATTGWGAMDAETWQAQIDQWEELGQFEADPPAVDDVMTTSILDATVDARQTGS